MKDCLLDLLRTLTLSVFLIAQLAAQRNLSLYVQGGVLIGSPVGVIPEGATGKLGSRALGGVEINWTPWQRWSLNLGAAFAHKSNEFQTPVTGKYDIAAGVLGVKLPFPINVKYRGIVKGEISNKYIDIPIYVGYQIGRRLRMTLGYQYSRLLEGRFDGKVDVKALVFDFPNQPFDESHLIREDDHAVMSGTQYRVFDRLELRFRVAYGLNSIFSQTPEGMTSLRNLYMGLVVAYGFPVVRR